MKTLDEKGLAILREARLLNLRSRSLMEMAVSIVAQGKKTRVLMPLVSAELASDLAKYLETKDEKYRLAVMRHADNLEKLGEAVADFPEQPEPISQHGAGKHFRSRAFKKARDKLNLVVVRGAGLEAVFDD